MPRRAHVSQPVISAYEGGRREPSLSMLTKLSVHLDDEAVEGPLTVTADDGDLPSEVRRRALQIAESAMWPGWEAGW